MDFDNLDESNDDEYVPNPDSSDNSDTDEEQIFRCRKCDSEFTFEVNLNNHIKANHRGTFGCSLCSYTFTNKELRDNHFENGHSDLEKYGDNSCLEMSNPNEANKPNETNPEVETGDESSKLDGNNSFRVTNTCNFCEHKFPTTYNFLRHMKNMHDNNGGKRRAEHALDSTKSKSARREFKCTICSKNFAQSSNLKRHSKIHW